MKEYKRVDVERSYRQSKLGSRTRVTTQANLKPQQD